MIDRQSTLPMKRFVFALLWLLCFLTTGDAYVLEGQRWFFSPVSIQMNLSATRPPSPAFPLLDGSESWESVYAESAQIWDQYMANLQIVTTTGNNTNGGQSDDGVNEAFFGSSLGGSTLDSNTLGLTVYSYDPSTNAMIEADTAFNPGVSWNSYRGPLLSDGVIDFRRVALHELGHIIGLDHPDQAGQVVNAIMNSVISNTDNVTADDIAGAQALYGARNSPAPAAQPTPTPPPPVTQVFPAADLNGDGRSDLVLFNQASNEVAVWLMSGNTIGRGAVVGNGPVNYRIAAVADLQNTGRAQIIWSNGSARYGAWSIAWSANNTPTTTGTWFLLPANYPVLLCADLDGDGLVDVVQFNPANGALLIAKNNGSLSFSTQFSTTVSPGWVLIGAADLNGTGQPQLIWRNADSGKVAAWVFSASSAFTPVQYPVFASPALDWSIRGIGHIDTSSAEGLIWRNAQTGLVALWKMNTNGNVTGTALRSAAAPWQIAANAFFDGTGADPEILWVNQQSGEIAVWRVNGLEVEGTPIGAPGSTWVVQPTASGSSTTPER
jgi:hypothetical protein